MGRFETTVEFYGYREPYPGQFFETVASRLGLTPQTRLLDIGCGPGNLVIGFAPYLGTCTAIDREPEMLRAAKQAALAAGVTISFIENAIEDLPADNNSFDLVTVGRALHWLQREETIAIFDNIVAPGGHIAVCGTVASSEAASEWDKPYREVRRTWSGEHDESRYRVDLEKWFAPSRFRKLEEINVEHRHWVSVEHLVKRMLSYSTVSPAVIGDKQPQFEADIRRTLEPFAKDGLLEEDLIVKATVFG